MEDYLRVIKNMKHNETSEENQKMKEYQNYVEIIQRSFNILKGRESVL